MTDDEVVTHQAVVDGLSPDMQRAFLLALPPEQRGWATAAEVEHLPGEWIEVRDLADAEPHYLPGRRP